MTEPWRDPNQYNTGQKVRCLGCNQPCHKTHWGKWCYDCNVKRIERINTAFATIQRPE